MQKLLLRLEMKKPKKSEFGNVKYDLSPEKTWRVFHSDKVNFEKKTTSQNENPEF